MRLPLIAGLILTLSGAAGAGSSSPKHSRTAAPIDPPVAASRVARYRDFGDSPRSAGSEGPVGLEVSPTQPDGPPGRSAPSSAPNPLPAPPPPAPAVPAAPPLIGPPPPLLLSVSHALVPAGETREVTVMGAATAPEVAAAPVGIISTRVAPGAVAGTWSLTLEGEAPGEVALRVSEGDRTQTLPVRVMRYAGQVSAAVVEITGQPAPGEFVLSAARAAAGEAIRREPGAGVAIGGPKRMPPELPAGQAATVAFPVFISGPGLLPVKTAATVTVRNRDLEPRDVGMLLYSNDPERICRAGTLFAAELGTDRPARLLYHHQNVGDEPLRLRLELINPTDQPVDVQVIEGAAGPTWDAVEAGHCAAARYVRSALQDLGAIARVPAHSEQAIALPRVPPHTTVSGLFGLRSLGPGLYVRVAAEAEAGPIVTLRPAEKPDRLSDETYLSPHRPLSARYVVGKNWAFLNLGSDPLVTRGSHRKLAGNYGVSYEMTLDLSNPTDQPQSVVLTLSPDAGEARGVFVIDGAVVEAPEVSPPVEAELATFRLQPRERRVVRVQTLPVGGSSYPARLVLRPADPLRTAQTIAGTK